MVDFRAVEELFGNLLATPRADRERALAAAPAHESIKAEVRAMLKDQEEAPGLFQGRLLGDRYELLRPIGEGSFGTVWWARDSHLLRDVALKLLRIDPSLDASTIDHMLREAQAAALSAQSPEGASIVSVYDAGRFEAHSCFYIAMELCLAESAVPDQPPVPAPSLADVVATRWATTSSWQTRSATWIAAVARALARAHQRGVVHRDVKPANILIAQKDRPKITDFGLAASGLAPEATNRTFSDSTCKVTTPYGTICGTPCYMPPEQALGERVDSRGDIYSLGATLYFALTRQPPYSPSGSSDVHPVRDVLQKLLLSSGPPRVPARSRRDKELSDIAAKAMSRHSAARYATADDFAADLERWVQLRPTAHSGPSPAYRALLWYLRHGILGKVVLTACALALAFAIWSLRQRGELLLQQERNVVLSLQREAREIQSRANDARKAFAAGDQTSGLRLAVDAVRDAQRMSAALPSVPSKQRDAAKPVVSAALRTTEETLRGLLYNTPDKRIPGMASSQVQLSQDGRWLAAIDSTQSLVLTDLSPSAIDPACKRMPIVSGVAYFGFTPDCAWLVFGTASGSIERYSLLKDGANGSSETIAIRGIEWRHIFPSISGRWWAVGNGSSIELWDVCDSISAPYAVLENQEPRRTQVFFDPKDQFAVVASPQGTIHTCRLDAEAAERVTRANVAVADDPEWMLSPAGKWLVYQDHEHAYRLHTADPAMPTRELTLQTQDGVLIPVAFGAGDKLLVVQNPKTALYLADLERDRPFESLYELEADWPICKPLDELTLTVADGRLAGGKTKLWQIPGEVRFNRQGTCLWGRKANRRGETRFATEQLVLWFVGDRTTKAVRASLPDMDLARFTPDGSYLVLVDKSGRMELQGVPQPDSPPLPYRELKSTDPIVDLEIGPDSGWLFGRDARGALLSWSLRSGFDSQDSHPCELLPAPTNQNANIVAVGDHAIVFNVEEGPMKGLNLWSTAAPGMHSEPMRVPNTIDATLSWISGAEWIATQDASQEFRLWHVDSTLRTPELQPIPGVGKAAWIHCVGGGLLLADDRDRCVPCARLEEGGTVPVGYPASATDCRVSVPSADGCCLLVSQLETKVLQFWSLDSTGSSFRAHPLDGLKDGIPVDAAIAFAPSSTHLACGTREGKLFVWRLPKGQEPVQVRALRVDSSIVGVQWLEDERSLLVQTSRLQLMLVKDAVSREVANVVSLKLPMQSRVQESCSPNGRFVLGGDGISTTSLWRVDPASGIGPKELRTWNVASLAAQFSSRHWMVFTDMEGTWLQALEPFPLKEPEFLMRLPEDGKYSTAVFSDDDRWLLTLREGGGSNLWLLDPGGAEKPLAQNLGSVAGTCDNGLFGPGSRFLALHADEHVFLWDLARGVDKGMEPVVLPTESVALGFLGTNRLVTCGARGVEVWTTELNQVLSYALDLSTEGGAPR